MSQLSFIEISDHPGYWITNTGELFVENYKRSGLGGFLSPTIGNHGYKAISLGKGLPHQRFLIHRLVGKYFVNNPNNLNIINHIDGNKLNNNSYNLEWCSQKHNVRHGMQFRAKRKGSVHKHGKYYRGIISVNNIRYENKFKNINDTKQWVDLKLRSLARKI